MSGSRRWFAVVGLWWVCLSVHAQPGALPQLNTHQQQWIADQIFQNECAGREACLTSWNAGEDFPSLGIGHFIWYRTGQQEAFKESFPDLLAFYVASGVSLPSWIAGLAEWDNPWSDRETFLASQDSERMQSLRQFLLETRQVQAAFIVQRMRNSLALMQAHSDTPDDLQQRFATVANAAPPYGMYALIDYVNFKGEGVSASERYQGQGWGLLQVLEHMDMAALQSGSGEQVLSAFARSAREILDRRIANAPAERNEIRWRAGWHKRTETYLPGG
ncbi:MAG: hypothetical protein P1V33_06925 [Pseudohongiella nitratireducens]|nr:hypothetical protein [Pseudohongiella nitratireducens]MDF1623182.1 hypothetical protein [Pseudohongiella nitratireducens]